MRREEETNHPIDWESDTTKALQERCGWLDVLRKMLYEIEEMPGGKELLGRWNVYFIESGDGIPRVNIDEPKRLSDGVFKCDGCGAKREGRNINVHTVDVSQTYSMPHGTVKLNYKYCNDKTGCGAKVGAPVQKG